MIDADVSLNPRVIHLLPLAPLTAVAFQAFGAVVEKPTEPGDRALYTQWLGSARAGMTPRLHANHVSASQLPLIIDTLEQHPYSAQVFLPLDVACYIVVVAPQNEAGGPDLAMAHAFLAPGNVGVIYAPGIWHSGAAVLDRDGSFAVLMWRNGTDDDEEFHALDASLQVQPLDTK